MKKENLKNKTFGKLLVLEEGKDKISPKGKRSTQWKCKCECGSEIVVTSNNLKRGHTKSCGCISKKKPHNYKHGKVQSRLYNIWSNMKQRCYNSKNKSFLDYGARGITICTEWKENFDFFYNWAIKNGYADNLTIDRINFNGNYEPNNCRFISKEEQARNKRNNHNITICNETHCMSEWSRILKISVETIKNKKEHELKEYYSSMKLSEREKK